MAKYSEYKTQYAKDHYKRIPLDVKPEEYDEWKTAAGDTPLNVFIKKCVDENLQGKPQGTLYAKKQERKSRMTPTEIAMENIRYLTTKNKMTVSELQKKIGVSNSFFSQKRKNGMSLDTAFKAARALKVTVDDLCSRKDFCIVELAELAAKYGYELTLKKENGNETL